MKPTTESLRTIERKASSLAASVADNPRTTLAIFEWLVITYAGFPFYVTIPACLLELIENDSKRFRILFPYSACMFLAGLFVWNGSVVYVGAATAVSILIHMIRTRKMKPYESANPFVTALFSVLLINDPLQGKWTSTHYMLLPIMSDSNYFAHSQSTIIMITTFFLGTIGLNAVFKKRTSYRIVGNATFLLGTLNFFTFSITGKPFMFSDLKKASTVLGVIGNVTPTKPMLAKYAVAVVAIVAFNVFATKTRIRNERPSNRRLCVEAGMAAIFICAVISFKKDGYLHYYANLNYEYVTSLLIEYGDSVKKPTYEDEFETFESLLERKDAKPDETKGTPKARPSTSTPNVITIMSEAFCDMQTVGDFELNVPYIPFTKKTTAENPHGITYASVHGNNTVSTEISFLTGVPTCLTASGAEIFEIIGGREIRSLTTPFERNGYATVGMHPYDRNGYNRAEAWKALGFDETEFRREFKDAETMPETGYVTDAAMFERAVEKIENEERPTFEFLVTMQNHAMYENEIDDSTAVENGPKEEEFKNYVSLQNVSDEALRNLLEDLEETDEPTMVMFFGDHLPMLGDEPYETLLGKEISKLDDAELRRLYAVPYFVWTNYDLDFDVPEETSMNRLGSVLLKAIGIDDPWFDYVDEVCEEYPVLTDCFFKIGDEWSSENLKNILKKTRNDESDPTRDLKQYQVYCVDLLDGRKGEEG